MKKISSLKHTQAGVTLVELMVGLTVGLVVTGGAMAILFGNQKMLLEKGRWDRTQEEFRFATTTITRLVRQADYFEEPDSNNELVINFDRSQRDCLGVAGLSSSNTLKLDNNQLLCIRDNDSDTSYVLAKNIGNLEFSYGIQQSGVVTYNSYFSNGTTVNTAVKNVLNNITSIKTNISIAQNGLIQQPTLEFIATSHQKSIMANLSSGDVYQLTEEELKKLQEEAAKKKAEEDAKKKADEDAKKKADEDADKQKALNQVLALLKVTYTPKGSSIKTVNWSSLVDKTTEIPQKTDVEVTLEATSLNLSGWNLSSDLNKNKVETLPDINTSEKKYPFDPGNGNKNTFSIYLKYGTITQSTITFKTTN